jgi:hypothetical protein
MQTSFEYSFPRYLEAKKSVDDRALNRQVWEILAKQLRTLSDRKPIRVLEIGAGIGSMIERILEWNLIRRASYSALDSLVENADAAFPRLSQWAARHNMSILTKAAYQWQLADANQKKKIDIQYLNEDLFAFIQRQDGEQKWDLLLAHAFLDLVDIPSTLPLLKNLLSSEGSFYFSLNFDGATIFEPAIDPAFDSLVEALYHRSMDERLIQGKASGDSQAGRHLFRNLEQAGLTITGAGASDWVVFPTNGAYPYDEAYFLHFIVHTLHQELRNHPELEAHRFEAWISKRRQQIEAAELVYIAHQLDFVGKLSPDKNQC